MTYQKTTPCVACGKPTYSTHGLHPACRFTLAAGDWAPGIVQLWKARQPAAITAPPVVPQVRERLATLTKAETEVLHLLASGHTPSDVAAIRTTTMATAWEQIKQIRRKLGVQTQAHAIALAWCSGWIKVADEQVKDGAA